MKGKEKQPERTLQPVPDFELQQQVFWQYTQPSKQQIEILANYLASEQQLINQYVFPTPCQNILDAYLKMTQYLKIQPHVAMVQLKSINPQQNAFEIEEDQIGEQGQSAFLVFQNYQIDVITLKVLNFVLAQFSHVSILKIFNCTFNQEEIKELCNIIQHNKILKLYLDFIICEESAKEQLIENLYRLLFNGNQRIKSPHIKYLTLRGSQLYDKDAQLIQEIWEQITFPSNLKALELTQNNIGRKGMQCLSNLLKKENKIEYLGLARNNIQSFEDIRGIADQLIKKKLTSEELQQYRDQEAQREAQIKQAQKLKKKGDPEIPLIKLDPLVQNIDGSFSTVSNLQFRILNLSQNSLGETEVDNIEKFIAQCPENFSLMLLSNNFENKTKEKLKRKYKNIIF